MIGLVFKFVFVCYCLGVMIDELCDEVIVVCKWFFEEVVKDNDKFVVFDLDVYLLLLMIEDNLLFGWVCVD